MVHRLSPVTRPVADGNTGRHARRLLPEGEWHPTHILQAGRQPRGGRAVKTSRDQAEKLAPQPQERVALGLLKTNPRPMSSSLKSTVVPFRYR